MKRKHKASILAAKLILLSVFIFITVGVSLLFFGESSISLFLRIVQFFAAYLILILLDAVFASGLMNKELRKRPVVAVILLSLIAASLIPLIPMTRDIPAIAAGQYKSAEGYITAITEISGGSTYIPLCYKVEISNNAGDIETLYYLDSVKHLDYARVTYLPNSRIGLKLEELS